MRFMVMVKGDSDTEAGAPPPTELLDAMTRYNEELVRAGVLLDANGLAPSSDGALVSFSNGEPTVIDGPFAEAKELVAGYWVLDVKSLEEAIEWVKRVPADPDVEAEIEIRPVFEGTDFGEQMTDEIRDRFERMARSIADKRG
ncbi:MAG TPA: YciI family protein [Actinophytocola sp.]|uniref:YciI family protein n=1 Tax=Actinophytocola sp. TaxID=1872138 RepID=UPI002F921319